MTRSFCHNVAVFPQPSPARNPGGDCFACAVTAALRHFFGEHAPTFDTVWECFLVESVSGSKVLSNTWPGYRNAFLEAAHAMDRRVEAFVDVALSPPSYWNDVEKDSYAWRGAIDPQWWARRLDAWLRSGHLAFCNIKMDASPTGEWHTTPEGPRRWATDHFVLLDGVREGWRKHPTLPASSLVYQVHVVCSARGGRAYWIDADKFVHEHGAGAWWLMRPDDRGALEE